jgi:2-polyprenyl-3-methyl-5-hydroxy-6-metoxy-1,4-benzoquinol methylase
MMVAGHYEKKQLLSRSRVVAWSHGARFRMARALVEPHAGKSLLDYGCGDGTFLKSVSDIFPNATGADIANEQIEDCRRRLPDHQFIHVDEIAGTFDVVTCMEVLEHCTPEAVQKVLTRLSSLIRRDGIVIISVPVETGPTLVAKQAIRRIAGWRGIGDYKWTESYSFSELIKMLFARAETSIQRPLYDGSHTHKGFNWHALESEIKRCFHITEKRFSPSSILRSQVWFVCEALNVQAAS